MKILVKTADITHSILASGKHQAHCANYYPFLFREAFRRLGHTVKFVGPHMYRDEILQDPAGWDMIFCWGLESFVFDKEYTTKLLQNFPGKKVLYITVKTPDPIVKLFDLVVGSDVESYRDFYGKNSLILPFSGPLPDFIDRDISNPYKDKETFRVIYTGIVTDRYLAMLNAIAASGFSVYLAGISCRAGSTGCRRFTPQELANDLHKSIKPLSVDGSLEYGYHFNYLKHAHCGLCFYPVKGHKAAPASSKLVDYAMCGLPVVCEDASPNAHVLSILEGGYTFEWGNVKDCLKKLVDVRNAALNRELIQYRARFMFDSIEIGRRICRQVLEG